MKIINIVLLIFVFIFGIFQMRKSSAIIKTEWFKDLSNNEKRLTTSKIKENWKISIILMSILVCDMLILISSFIGKTHYYENIINIAIFIVSILVVVGLVINNRKFNKDIKK